VDNGGAEKKQERHGGAFYFRLDRGDSESDAPRPWSDERLGLLNAGFGQAGDGNPRSRGTRCADARFHAGGTLSGVSVRKPRGAVEFVLAGCGCYG
jgi:hypothetical protein